MKTSFEPVQRKVVVPERQQKTFPVTFTDGRKALLREVKGADLLFVQRHGTHRSETDQALSLIERVCVATDEVPELRYDQLMKMKVQDFRRLSRALGAASGVPDADLGEEEKEVMEVPEVLTREIMDGVLLTLRPMTVKDLVWAEAKFKKATDLVRLYGTIERLSAGTEHALTADELAELPVAVLDEVGKALAEANGVTDELEA